MADLLQLSSLKGAGAFGEVSLSNLSNKDVYTEAQRLALDVTELKDKDTFIIVEQSDSTDHPAGIYTYSGKNEKWLYLGGKSKTLVVVDNPITTPPTAAALVGVEKVLYLQAGTNNSRYLEYNVVDGDVFAAASDVSVVEVDDTVADVTQPNTWQRLNDGTTVFVDWDENIVEMIASEGDDKSKFTLRNVSLTAGIPIYIYVSRLIPGKKLVDMYSFDITAYQSGFDKSQVLGIRGIAIGTGMFGFSADADINNLNLFIDTEITNAEFDISDDRNFVIYSPTDITEAELNSILGTTVSHYGSSPYNGIYNISADVQGQTNTSIDLSNKSITAIGSLSLPKATSIDFSGNNISSYKQETALHMLKFESACTITFTGNPTSPVGTDFEKVLVWKNASLIY